MEEKNRYYQSHQKLAIIGAEGQAKLSQARVLVIGAGGLGCPCLLYLAGCGPGIIGIADFDTISLSNLHRQVLYTMQDIGEAKTATAIKRSATQNSNIKFRERTLLVNEANVLRLINDYDVIVDGTDNFQVRYLINDACVYLEKPLVYGAIHQTEGHVTVFNYHGSPTLRCLFPEPDANHTLPSCADIGAYNIITGIIGIMMANEVIKIIVGNPDVLAGKLNCIDAMAGSLKQFSYKLSTGNITASTERFHAPPSVMGITLAAFRDKMSNQEIFHLIDVRTHSERQVFHIGGLHLPVEQFQQLPFEELFYQKKILPEQTIIVYCQRGSRSASVVRTLREKGFDHAYSLEGGIEGWKQNGTSDSFTHSS